MELEETKFEIGVVVGCDAPRIQNVQSSALHLCHVGSDKTSCLVLLSFCSSFRLPRDYKSQSLSAEHSSRDCRSFGGINFLASISCFSDLLCFCVPVKLRQRLEQSIGNRQWKCFYACELFILVEEGENYEFELN